uniref:Nucleoporin_C domain-containing protein n=1 Tax=Heterorhabditis bacteriophora TaxID=37862 RepID=A0A1I7XKW4_HETBA
MSERVMVTLAVRSWQTSNEDHSEAICMVGEKMAKIIGHKGEPESILFGKLSIIHLLPQSLVACVRSLLSRSGSAQLVKSARLELLYMGADLLLTYANAIEACRRSVNGVLVSVGDAQWTTGHISDAYLHMCKVLIAEMQSTDVSNSEKNRLRDFVVRHAVFHLGECDSNIDGHEIIVSLYDLGEYKVAVDLAERFKDFKVLVKVCLEFDGQERRTKLDLYKQRFAADDFDLYLCQYLKQRNLNELLLEERGERIDRYLSSCDGIRWRRELQKHQYNVFPDNPSRPLTAAEMIELNMIDTVEDMDAIDGYLRAICLLGSLLEECDSPDLRSHLVHVWTSAVKRDDWTNVKSASDAASSTFGLLLRAVLDNDWPLSTKTLVMPPSDTILKECAQHLKKNESAEKWIRKGAEKARLDLRDQQSGR